MADEDTEPVKEESRAKKITKIICHVLFHIIFIGYFIYATVIYIIFNQSSSKCTEPETTTTEATTTVAGAEEPTTEAPPPPWKPHILCELNCCIGYGMLLILFVIFYVVWFYYWVFKPFVGQKLYDNYIEPIIDKWIVFSRKLAISIISLIIVLALTFAYLGFECRDDVKKVIGLSAPIVFILIGFAVSHSRKSIPWRVVVHGILGQLILGVLIIRLELGRKVLECVGEKATIFLNYTAAGARFVYGDRICDEYVFAFAILAVIFFFSVVTSILYYLGVMQFLLGAFGFFLQATVGTTVCESVNAVGNVFLGMSESPLMIRPYISILTKSELHTICTSGYATVAGTVLGAYISFGASPAYLITASVMAAPGSLAFAKLFYPETEESKTKTENIKLEKSAENSILDAATSGAANGLMIVLGVVSNIIAFLAIIAFLNAFCEWIFELLNLDGITFIYLLTKMFIPLVFLMGVPVYDCEQIAGVVAEKTLINEFIAYKHLGDMIKDPDIKLDDRSIGIATFALCGFANPGSLGILIAALSAMAPARRSDITNVAVRAFFAGSIVSFTSAAFAGILIQGDELAKRVQN